MNRLIVMFVTIIVIAALGFSAMAASSNFPSIEPKSDQPSRPAVATGQPQLYYGYVPPPPIRHTWPGGYRVIFHEMINNLMEHMTGHY
jgi:hypothetical protein